VEQLLLSLGLLAVIVAAAVVWQVKASARTRNNEKGGAA
jgi:hypothetical protein